MVWKVHSCPSSGNFPLIEDEQFHPCDSDYVRILNATNRIRVTSIGGTWIDVAEYHPGSYTLLPNVYQAMIEAWCDPGNPLRIPYQTVIWGRGNGVGDGRFDLDSTIPLGATYINATVATFHKKETKDSCICVNPFVTDIKISNDMGMLTPAGGIFMNTYNDNIQRSLVLDAVNYNNNPIVSINRDYDHSITPYRTVHSWDTASNAFKAYKYLRYGDLTNFLLAIPYASDGTHREGIFASGKQISWVMRGRVDAKIRDYQSNEIDNPFRPRRIILYAFQDDYLLLTASMIPMAGQVMNDI
jgi:hypothetical protein